MILDDCIDVAVALIKPDYVQFDFPEFAVGDEHDVMVASFEVCLPAAVVADHVASIPFSAHPSATLVPVPVSEIAVVGIVVIHYDALAAVGVHVIFATLL